MPKNYNIKNFLPDFKKDIPHFFNTLSADVLHKFDKRYFKSKQSFNSRISLSGMLNEKN